MPPRTACRLRSPERSKVDKRPDVLVAELAARDWGVVSLEELLHCGVSRGGVVRRVRNGRLHPLHRTVFAVGHPNVPLEGRFLAAVKACGPRALLSHFAAAALWGLVEWDHREVEVTVVGTAARIHPGLRVHRTLRRDDEDITSYKGIPVTSLARTLVDLAGEVPYVTLRRAVREAVAVKGLDLAELLAALARLGPRPGTRSLRRIIASGPSPTRSVLEDVVFDLIVRAGFERPDVNVPLVLDGRRVVPDFRWAADRLVVEADGAAWHDHKLAREDDAERQALLERHGERVLRVTWDQAVRRPAETLARLRAAGVPLREAASRARLST